MGASREVVAKALRTVREHGRHVTGRRTMTVLDLDGPHPAGGPVVNKPAVARAPAAVRRGSRARFVIWVFHLALPLADL